ncbi:MAG: hypothetical protein HGB12_00285 [Bacteroidetes bacterium]|nr:hypothetical protein [Bacteroidota bacterium]
MKRFILVVLLIFFIFSFVHSAAYDQVAPYTEVTFKIYGVKVTAPKKFATKIYIALEKLNYLNMIKILRLAKVNRIEIDYYPVGICKRAIAYVNDSHIDDSRKNTIYFVFNMDDSYFMKNYIEDVSYDNIAVTIMHECYHLTHDEEHDLEEENAQECERKARILITQEIPLP